MLNHHLIRPMLGLALMTTLFTIPLAGVSRPTFASSSESSAQDIAVPNRRKPAGSREPSDLAMPERRKPGSARSDIAMPERRKPGSARPLYSCHSGQEQLTALIPQNLKGLTSSATPDLFFYVPAIESKTEVEFVIRDQSDRLVYEKSFRGNDRAGILKLPISSTSLKKNEEYHWYLSIVCNQGDRANDVVVEGLIERVNLPKETRSSLITMDLSQQVTFYQSHQLWQDSLTVLADSQKSGHSPAELIPLWQQILKSADLDPSLAQEPMLSLPGIEP